MRKTPEQRKAYLEMQLNNVKAKINKKNKQESNAKRKETDH